MDKIPTAFTELLRRLESERQTGIQFPSYLTAMITGFAEGEKLRMQGANGEVIMGPLTVTVEA